MIPSLCPLHRRQGASTSRRRRTMKAVRPPRTQNGAIPITSTHRLHPPARTPHEGPSTPFLNCLHYESVNTNCPYQGGGKELLGREEAGQCTVKSYEMEWGILEIFVQKKKGYLYIFLNSICCLCHKKKFLYKRIEICTKFLFLQMEQKKCLNPVK